MEDTLPWGRLSNSEYLDRPWLAHAFLEDFDLLDVWACPVAGRPTDRLEDFLRYLTDHEPCCLAGVMHMLRDDLGRRVQGKPFSLAPPSRPIPGCSETGIVQRLPPNLQGTALGTRILNKFSDIYYTEDESLFEGPASVGHLVYHFGRVPMGDDSKGQWYVQMAVLAKTFGKKADLWTAVINPVRQNLIYPFLVRQWGLSWSKQRRSQST